jgi:nucleotide-binding universal stress UspA family protein
MSQTIVVGVTADTGSSGALRWAAEEAQQRDAQLRAVMAWRPSPLPGGAPGRPPAQEIVDVDLQQVAQETLDELVRDTLGDDHGVECRAVEGRPGSVLLREAEDADLLVVDSPRAAKRYSGARRLAPRLIFRAPCPVVVMPLSTTPAAKEDETVPEQAEAAAGPAGPIST